MIFDFTGQEFEIKEQMNIKKIVSTLALLFAGLSLAHAGNDRPTKFTNSGGISNTRHNMTQRPAAGGINGGMMDYARNDYGEVCVYCHTPHGAGTTVNLPLWNRTIKATTYATYNQLGTSTLTQEVSQPGANSLACLSCHDGQTAIDSIINMPGSGRYQASQATNADSVFLSTWTGNTDVEHQGLSSGGLEGVGCLSCHAPGKLSAATDFTIFNIGTDLKNDHPVGVTFPATSGAGTDFNKPLGKRGSNNFFDLDANGRMETGEVRLYDNAGTAKVECASCHDPHGVPTAGNGSQIKPTFLRVVNTGSALCLTCHAK